MKRCYRAVVLALALLVSLTCGAQQEGAARWFVAEALNSGLGAAPDEVARLSPRETVRSLFTLVNKDDAAAAAHLLNLSELPPGEQRATGGELARQLASVLEHGEWINVSGLPARRDAMIQDPSGQHPRAGEPRRNLKLAALEVGGEIHDVRLARYRVGEQPPVWLFTPETVAAIPRLYDAFGPAWIEGYIPERLNQPFGVLRLWEWLAIPLFLLLLGLLGWAVSRGTDWLAYRLPAGLSSIFAGRIGTPLAGIAVALVAQQLLQFAVSFSGVAMTFLRILLAIVLAWGVGLIALRLVDTVLLKISSRLIGEIDDTRHRDERRLLTSLYALRRTIILVAIVVATVYVLGQLQIFDTLGMSLLASASVLTVLVGIAGQAVLGNILASFQVSLAKPVRIGDCVLFEEQWCYVEGIFYTFIRLRTWDERRLIVPVRYFISRPFENLSAKNAKMYRSLVLKLHFSADVERLREVFVAFAREEEGVIDPDSLQCYVTDQSVEALEVTFYLMAAEPISGWIAEGNLRERMLKFIREEHPEWWPREILAPAHREGARRDDR